MLVFFYILRARFPSSPPTVPNTEKIERLLKNEDYRNEFINKHLLWYAKKYTYFL